MGPRSPASATIAAAVVFSATALSLAPASADGQDADYGAVRAYVAERQHEIVDELVRLLEIPNVAADLPNIRRNADFLEEMLRRRGAATRQIPTAGGQPLVYGEIPVAGARTTVLFYAHYDGQPADPSAWVGHGPWEPALRAGPLDSDPSVLPWPDRGVALEPEWRLYARSASDDKAPIVALLTALDALRAQGLEPSANLKFLFEGEEETGSRHLPEALRTHRGLLAADVAVIADGPVHPSGAPTVTLGVRGIVTAEVTVYGALRPLHSGHYGNWAPNPAERLARLIAGLKAPDGRVLVEGWTDDVVPLGEADRAALDRLPSGEAERRALGIAEPHGEGRSRYEMVTRPSLNVRGLRSAWVGEEARTIVPDRAVASFDFRLVPNIRPADQVERFVAHLRREGYHVVQQEPDLPTRLAHPLLARVAARDGYPAVRTRADHPAARALIREVEAAAGRAPVVIPSSGGSVPAYVFPEILGATYLSLPTVNPDNNQHSPNENLRLGHLFDGIVTLAAALRTPWEGAGARPDR